MVKGAIHPNGSNFRRVARLDVVARVRRMVQMDLLQEKPPWLEWCERVPPLENHSLQLQARTVRNPYRHLVNFLLQKYPDLRFQDCYVDGNDWSRGNDAYRDDHPVMQFVARQLELMRTEGLSRKEAFRQTEEMFRDRREKLEQEQKIMMAMAHDAGLKPMFTTGKAYLEVEKARAEEAHLEIIRHELRRLRKKAAENMQMEDEGSALIDFGKFQGRTFSDVMKNEPEYCKWTLEQPAQGKLKVFQDFLRSKEKVPARLQEVPARLQEERMRKELVSMAVKEGSLGLQPEESSEITGDRTEASTELDASDASRKDDRDFMDELKSRKEQVDDERDFEAEEESKKLSPLPSSSQTEKLDQEVVTSLASSRTSSESIDRPQRVSKMFSGGVAGEDKEDDGASARSPSRELDEEFDFEQKTDKPGRGKRDKRGPKP